jgi:hypothetical protein
MTVKGGKWAAGPETTGDGRRMQHQHRPNLPAGRPVETAPAYRARQQRTVRISYEDPKAQSPLGVGTSVVSWAVVLGGMLLAVVGIVHASWRSSGENRTVTASIAEDVLNRQIVQLRAELDKERSEKSELTERIVAIKTPPPPPQPVPVQTVTQSLPEPETPEESAEMESASLPQPMAPSVELMLSDVPLNSVPVSSEPDGSSAPAFGIHLASFIDRTMAERGWLLLQRNHAAALGELKPRIDEAKDDNGNPVFLLIAGPFDSEEKAAAHCKKITTQVVFCKPRPFSGIEFAATSPQQ